MTLLDAATEFLSPKKRGRPPLPGGNASTAAPVEAKIEAARARLEALVGQHPELALASVSEPEPGPATAQFDRLKLDIAAQERHLADLDSALQAARANDTRSLRQQTAALRRIEVSAIKRDLRAR